MNRFEKIAHWAITFGLPYYENPRVIEDPDERWLCARLIIEEWGEFIEATIKDDEIAQIDALGDLYWVILRALHHSGQNIEYVYKNPMRDKMKIYNENLFRNLGHKITNAFCINKYLFSYDAYPWLKAIEENLSLRGYDIEDVISIIYESNMSKLFQGKEADKYRALAKENPEKYRTIETESGLVVIKDDKVIKPSTYKKPDWSKLVKTKK